MKIQHLLSGNNTTATIYEQHPKCQINIIFFQKVSIFVGIPDELPEAADLFEYWEVHLIHVR